MFPMFPIMPPMPRECFDSDEAFDRAMEQYSDDLKRRDEMSKNNEAFLIVVIGSMILVIVITIVACVMSFWGWNGLFMIMSICAAYFIAFKIVRRLI